MQSLEVQNKGDTRLNKDTLDHLQKNRIDGGREKVYKQTGQPKLGSYKVFKMKFYVFLQLIFQKLFVVGINQPVEQRLKTINPFIQRTYIIV